MKITSSESKLLSLDINEDQKVLLLENGAIFTPNGIDWQFDYMESVFDLLHPEGDLTEGIGKLVTDAVWKEYFIFPSFQEDPEDAASILVQIRGENGGEIGLFKNSCNLLAVSDKHDRIDHNLVLKALDELLLASFKNTYPHEEYEDFLAQLGYERIFVEVDFVSNFC